MTANDENYVEITEGKTTFTIFQDADRIYENSVFYNPKMVINRDLTLLALNSLLQTEEYELFFLDPFAGTGVRSFRILNELPKNRIFQVLAGDWNPVAIEIIKRNIRDLKLNGKFKVIQSEALELIDEIPKEKKLSKVIDLDPFGSPIEFIEKSIRTLRISEGYIFATSTDLQVLCGKFPDACLRIYNSIPTRFFLCHEVGIRILLYNFLISGGRLGAAIQPMFSYNHEHFLRIKAKIIDSKELANKQHQQTGYVHFCNNCSYFITVRIYDNIKSERCPICSEQLEKAGPLWLGPINHAPFIKNMLVEINNFSLSNNKKISKLLEQVLSEAEAPPFFYFIPYVLRYNKKDGITLQQLIEALKREGFFASRTAFDHQGLKTSAAYNDLVDIINQF